MVEGAPRHSTSSSSQASRATLRSRLRPSTRREPKPGLHCGELYCPARLTCPLGNTAMAEVVDGVPADSLVRRREYRITDPITTPEHAAWALDVCRLVGAKLDAIGDSIKAMVPPGGLTLEDGASSARRPRPSPRSTSTRRSRSASSSARRRSRSLRSTTRSRRATAARLWRVSEPRTKRTRAS